MSNENVRLVSLKKAEDQENALVLRFIETQGKETDCDLDVFFKPSKITYITNDEKELGKIPINGNKISFKCKPYSYTAVKVFGDFNI